MKKVLALICSLYLALACTELSAGIITTDVAGDVTGIKGLSAGGGLFDLQFVGFGQSYTNVFGGALDVTSDTLAKDHVFYQPLKTP